MKKHYDSEADILYLGIKEKQCEILTDSFSMDGVSFGTVNFDFNKEGIIVGIEIQNASKILHCELLN